jgi:hypothetical protein
MTIDPKQPALGPVNIDHGVETGLGRRGDRKQHGIVRSTWSSGDIRDTNLERRVLAHECILQVLIAHHGQRGKVREPVPDWGNLSKDDAPSSGASAVTQLEVKRHVAVWEIIRDGQFYGHYGEDQPAFDAAVAVVANGGSAEFVWTDSRPKSAISDQAESSRIIEFSPVRRRSCASTSELHREEL